MQYPTRQGDVVATSLDTSQWRRSDVSNETLDDVSAVRYQDVSLVRLHDAIEECRSDFLRKRNYDVTLVHRTSQTSLK